MSKENPLEEMIFWGSESKENKKKAIAAFTFAISALNASDKKLSEKELEKLAGGKFGDFSGPPDVDNADQTWNGSITIE